MASSESPQTNEASRQASSDKHDVVAITNGDAKRKAESSGTHTRAKRNRYISIACNECKRRKIKCNGQMPCQRCGHLNLECQYAPNCCSSIKDSEEFRSMKEHISTLQEQVNTLFANLNEFRLEKQSDFAGIESNGYTRDDSRSLSMSVSGLPPLPPLPQPPRPRHPRFHGPMSSAFNFDVAKSSLQTMGITTQQEDSLHEELVTRDATPIGSPHGIMHIPIHPSKDPLWAIPREEAIRLCRVYEEEVGIMYPVLDIEKIISQVNLLYTFLEAAARTGFAQRGLPGSDAMNDQETNILKTVFALTLAVEGGGRSDLGKRFFDSVKPSVDAAIYEPVDIKTIKLLTIVAMHHFHRDDDILAYRSIGIVCRMCLELGLHRRDALTKTFPVEAECLEASRVFWSVYILDRRWSFGTGLPFVIQDEDIDSSLPEPDSTFPYLRAMVGYNRIGSKVWYSGLGSEGATDVKRDDIGFLDYQVLQWQKQIPEELKFFPDSPGKGDLVSRGQQRLRVLLYLRANQMRILIYRPVLHSVTSIMENRSCSQTVVNIAKDTIRVLTHLNQTSDIYRSQQVCFNYFLVAALAVLFLAMSHAPVEFSRPVRDEFYMALDLIKGFSTNSYVSKRLWKTIKGLREIGDKLGLTTRGSGPADPHSSAAVAMAGLAGHPMENLAGYGHMVSGKELGNSPLDGQQMSTELTNLFEAMGAMGGLLAGNGGEGIDGYVGSQGGLHNTGEGLPAVLGNEGEFSRIMRDLF